MNYGADAADQMVRYSLEGVEYTVKLSGALAKNLAVFVAAVLKDQKKTRGRTRMGSMLKEKRPLKFFTVPDEKLRQFAREAKARGLLYVVIKDKKKKTHNEIMVFADDAAKMNRVLDQIGIDYAKAEYGKVEFETVREKSATEHSHEDQDRTGKDQQKNHARKETKEDPVKTQTVELPEGTIEFEVREGENIFDIGEIGGENFTKAQENRSPSGNSLRNRNFFSGEPSDWGKNRTSVRKELKEIKAGQVREQNRTAQRRSRRQNTRKRQRAKMKGR